MAEWVVFRLSALGDVALMTGVLDHAHREAGHAFTVVTREALAPLFANHPAVTRVERLPQGLSLFQTLTFFRQLARTHKGQTLLDWHGTLRSRLLALCWQGPVRRYRKEGLPRRLYLVCRKIGFLAHATRLSQALTRCSVPQRYAATLYRASTALPMAEHLTPRLFLTETEREAARTRLAQALPARAASQPLVALHPYATHINKAWPGHLWLRLMRLLHEQNVPFFIVGKPTPGQTPLPVPSFPVVDFSGQTTLREICALLAEASVLVSGDSGPLHLACGVGAPVVALFGPTTNHWGFFPQGPRDRVLQAPYACRPCSLHGQGRCPHQQRCLRDLEPELVLRAILGILT